MTPRRLLPDAAELPQILCLIHRSFAAMEGRINPPSSVHQLTAATLAEQCQQGEVWCLGDPPQACVFLTPHSDCLYLGKLATETHCRGQGLARRLIDLACLRARALGYNALELQVRIELIENQRIFSRLGFVKTAETAHAGFNHPTSVTMRRSL